jgi:manganese/iron transport system permease protein
VVILAILLLYRPFLIISFDPVLASTLHMPAELLRNLMLVLLAITVVVSLQTVGIGLVAAMLITPAATSYLLTRRLPSMMMVAAAIGALSSIIGLYLSYYFNVASGAAIVLVATGFFILAFLFAPQRGWVQQMARQRE